MNVKYFDTWLEAHVFACNHRGKVVFRGTGNYVLFQPKKKSKVILEKLTYIDKSKG